MTDAPHQNDQRDSGDASPKGTGFESATRKVLLFFIVMMFPVIIGLVILNVQKVSDETTEIAPDRAQSTQVEEADLPDSRTDG